jgi:hypothetical protein
VNIQFEQMTDEEIDAAKCCICGGQPCTLFTGDPWSMDAYCEEHGPDNKCDPQEDDC